MFMYVRLITESEDTRLFVSRTRRRQKRSIGGVREGHTRILSATLVQYSVLLSLCLRRRLLICSLAVLPATHDSPMPRASFIPGGRLLRLISILETSPFRGLSSRSSRSPALSLPISFRALQSLSSSLVYELPDSFPSFCRPSLRRSESRSSISGENELFPCVPE